MRSWVSSPDFKSNSCWTLPCRVSGILHAKPICRACAAGLPRGGVSIALRRSGWPFAFCFGCRVALTLLLAAFFGAA